MVSLQVIIRNKKTLTPENIRINSIKEASQKVLENTQEINSLDWYGAEEDRVGIVYYDNNPICKISYNGRVWSINERNIELNINADIETILKGEAKLDLIDMLSQKDIEALDLAVDFAVRNYQGHYTLLKFTTNYRFCFGTLSEINNDIIKLIPKGFTMAEAIQNALKSKRDSYNIIKVYEDIKNNPNYNY